MLKSRHHVEVIRLQILNLLKFHGI